MASDLAPFAGTVGGWFLIGFVTGYAIKKVIKLAAVIFGLIIAAIGNQFIDTRKSQPIKMTLAEGYCLCRDSLFDNSTSMKTDIAFLVLWPDDIITGKLLSISCCC